MLALAARVLQHCAPGRLTPRTQLLRCATLSGRANSSSAGLDIRAAALQSAIHYTCGPAQLSQLAGSNISQVVQLHLFGLGSRARSHLSSGSGCGSSFSFPGCATLPPSSIECGGPQSPLPRPRSGAHALGRAIHTARPAIDGGGDNSANTIAGISSSAEHGGDGGGSGKGGSSARTPADPDYWLSLYSTSGADRRRNNSSEVDMNEVRLGTGRGWCPLLPVL